MSTGTKYRLAWAAGFFEAKGTVTTSGSPTRRRLAVRMRDEEAVRRFADIVGLGHVYGPYGPYESSLGTGVTWLWVAERAEATTVAKMLLPFLGSRVRERLDEWA